MNTKNLTLRQVAGASAAVIVALAAVWYLVLIRPESHQLAAARRADAAAQTQIASLHDQVAQLDAFKAHLAQDRARLQAAEQAIPNGSHLASAIRSIQAAAVANGVTLTSLDPQVPAPGSAPTATVGSAAVLPVSINVGGSYAGLVGFMQALDAMPRTLVVDTVNISGTDSNLTLALSTDLFYTGS
jgi:Tfp pilus assembly protein PilO